MHWSIKWFCCKFFLSYDLQDCYDLNSKKSSRMDLDDQEQPFLLGPLKSLWWIHALAPYFSPLMTGIASWTVRMSFLLGSESRTDGQSTARPLFGVTIRSSSGNFVPPPSSTSLR
mmetsp:Transcript_9554/g.15334  ORF Transcript_9554/g.15334 Transcript_9554/m.15334 type:complete len:115 (-) Transcript_9554:415-759(-)